MLSYLKDIQHYIQRLKRLPRCPGAPGGPRSLGSSADWHSVYQEDVEVKTYLTFQGIFQNVFVLVNHE